MRLTTFTGMRTLIAIVCLVLAAASAAPAARAQTPGTMSPAGSEGLDLARVLPRADDLPEAGYRGGGSSIIPAEAIAYDSGPDSVRPDDVQASGYIQSLVLGSDPGDETSVPIGSFVSVIRERESSAAARTWLDAEIRERQDAEYLRRSVLPAPTVEPVPAPAGATALVTDATIEVLFAYDQYTIELEFATIDQGPGIPHDTSMWTPESVGALGPLVTTRIDEARALRERGDLALGSAAVRVSTHEVIADVDFDSYQDDFYLVIDGEVQPQIGDTEVPAAENIAPGLTDLYASDHHFVPSDEDDGEFVHRISLARFATPEDARAFLADPETGSRTPEYGLASYGSSSTFDDGVIVSQGTVELGYPGQDDIVDASAIRMAGQFDTLVVVVEWFATGELRTDERATRWLFDQQAACVERSPEPCVPILYTDVVAATEHLAMPGATPDATPAPASTHSRRSAG